MSESTALTDAIADIPEQLESLVVLLRGQRVMLSPHLAALYGVEPRSLVQAVKRNKERFPADFMFQLTDAETQSLRSQFVTAEEAASETEDAFKSQFVISSGTPPRPPRAVFDALRQLMTPPAPKQGRIGFRQEKDTEGADE